jgi:hypothetical protein
MPGCLLLAAMELASIGLEHMGSLRFEEAEAAATWRDGQGISVQGLRAPAPANGSP